MTNCYAAGPVAFSPLSVTTGSSASHSRRSQGTERRSVVFLFSLHSFMPETGGRVLSKKVPGLSLLGYASYELQVVGLQLDGGGLADEVQP
jgi:hypothetical protein